MPISRKRKKKGKPVGNGEPKNRAAHEERLDGMQAGVTLQDLINVVAYQEYVKDGSIVAADAKIHIPDVMPVTVGEGEDKRVVGTATKIPGVEGQVSIEILDKDVASYIADTASESYSIDKEQN